MKKLPVKVGFCVAYDWYLLARSLPLIYDFTDSICLSLDKDRISWSGKPFSFDEQGFFSLVEKIDKQKKIIVYEDDFHLASLSPMQNEVRQRTLMTGQQGREDSWFLQLDADEYFLNFEGFVNYIQKFNRVKRKINICCPWITMYKQVNDDFFLIYPQSFNQHEFIQIATRWPYYEHGRRNGYFNILTNFFILHQSWAREEHEILHKLQNWGHSNEIDSNKYFKLWKECGADTFSSYKNFHHLGGDAWPSLVKVKAKDIFELKEQLLKTDRYTIPEKELARKNSIWRSRLNSIVQKIH